MKNFVLTLKSQIPWMLKSELHRWLAASALFSVLMVMARIVYTGELTFIFLVWNLFLAYVPYFLSSWLQYHPAWIEDKRKFAAAFICWLLFIPNSFYILTDLFHLRSFFSMPMWFDLALLLSFAWNGLLAGIISVRQMEKMMKLQVNYKHELYFVFPIMWMNALGIFIGRYLRFNSWDVLSSPFGLVSDMAAMVLHPIYFKDAWAMIFCYAALMSLIYVTLKKVKL
ncbi:MAG: DUF1361 domain-containing protein [Chitinophagaceae bacterium]